MAKRTPYIVAYTLIARDAAGRHISGTGSKGDLGYAKGLAYSWLRTDLTKQSASIDIYAYDPKISWRDLQPLCTVTLDDEGVEE
jgi:hypothetical protein